MHRLPALLLLALALPLAACKQAPPPAAAVVTPPAAPPATAAAPAVAADDNLNAVVWVQASAEYKAACETVFHAAADKLDAALAAPHWDALVPEERANDATGLAPAIVMDVDETVLDNSPYQARLVATGKEYDEVGWGQWVAEKKARPVPGVVDFARAASARGIAIVYLSNRAVHLKDATIANLKAAGLPVADDSVFLGLGTVVAGCEQNGSDKNCRRQLAGRRYRVLMQFGDQLGDFVQVLDATPAGRDRLLARYADWFGERWWMLPNPTYGAWEPALFHNDWAQPRAVRRQAKRDALRLAR